MASALWHASLNLLSPNWAWLATCGDRSKLITEACVTSHPGPASRLIIQLGILCANWLIIPGMAARPGSPSCSRGGQTTSFLTHSLDHQLQRPKSWTDYFCIDGLLKMPRRIYFKKYDSQFDIFSFRTQTLHKLQIFIWLIAKRNISLDKFHDNF